MARADSDITARWVAVAAFVDDTRRAECSPAQVAQRLTELCVHTLGFAGATVQLLEPARGTVGLVAPGPGKGALRSRLVAAQALAQEVLRRESSRFIEQPGRPVRVAVAALPARLTMPADRDPSRAAPPHLGRPSADLARGAAGDGRQVAGSGPRPRAPAFTPMKVMVRTVGLVGSMLSRPTPGSTLGSTLGSTRRPMPFRCATGRSPWAGSPFCAPTQTD